jgi:alkylation response protein AidB-like acyl-CoA dehydrogenase
MNSDEILAGIGDLLPVIRARREEIELARRMPRDLVESLRKTGVFALGAPRSIGGHEASEAEAGMTPMMA